MTNFYQATAEKYIEIDGEGNELICTIPSEKDASKRYELKCVESATSVEVCSCTCKGFEYTGHCKHQAIVQAFWNRIYKTNVVKAEAKSAIEVAEQIIAESTETHESTTIQAIESSKDLGMTGNLNGAPTSREMPAWLAILPSRRALAS